jgi:hypothetical protein
VGETIIISFSLYFSSDSILWEQGSDQRFTSAWLLQESTLFLVFSSFYTITGILTHRFLPESLGFRTTAFLSLLWRISSTGTTHTNNPTTLQLFPEVEHRFNG